MSLHGHIVVVLVVVGCVVLVVDGVVDEVSPVALEVGDEVGLIVEVVGCVEISLVVVECGLVGIVVVVKV